MGASVILVKMDARRELRDAPPARTRRRDVVSI